MFLIGFIAAIVVGAYKLWAMHHGGDYKLVTDSPYFFIALAMMILGSQFFIAGFLGEMVSRNSSERNKYQIEKVI